MSDLEKKLREKTILEEYVLDKTDLDEKALKAVDDIENFLNERKNNVVFVWNKFRKSAYMFIFSGFVVGISLGWIIF
tara:strand:+ start:415 stop:645 length:231 start_codon:yes stop_codon:yes gene_type:complete